MTTIQKVIKYLSIAFAVFLIFTIFSAIIGAIYGISTIVGNNNTDIVGNDNTEEMQTIDLNSDNNMAYLDVDILYTNLVIKTGDYFLAKTSNNNIECKQNGNKIVITEKQDNWFFKKQKGDLVITIPSDLEFEKVKISNGAGKLSIEKLITDELDLNLGAGETIIDNIISSSTKIDTGVGRTIIKDGKIKDLDLDIGIGESEITAKLVGKNKIDTGVGALKLNLLGSNDDYEININKGIGEIKVDGKSVSDNVVIGTGENNVVVKGGLGEIKINFKSE